MKRTALVFSVFNFKVLVWDLKSPGFNILCSNMPIEEKFKVIYEDITY